MTMKGTGWVPDFPNVKDYTLRSQSVQELGNQIQTAQSIGSVENLEQQVSQILELIRTQSKKPDSPKTEETDKLNVLIETLNKKNSGGIYFSPAKIHRHLTPGISNLDILTVKKYLKSIYPSIVQEIESEKENYLIDPIFDEETKSLIEDFKIYKKIPDPSLIDYETIINLKSIYDLTMSLELIDITSKSITDDLNANFIKKDDLEKIIDNSNKNIWIHLPEGGKVFDETCTYIIEELYHGGYDLPENATPENAKILIEDIDKAIRKIRDYLSRNQLSTPLLENLLEPGRSSLLATMKGIMEGWETRIQQAKVGGDTFARIEEIQIQMFHTTIKASLLLPKSCLASDEKLLNIPCLIPSKIFNMVLRKMISDKRISDIEQYIKPVSSLMISRDSGMQKITYVNANNLNEKPKDLMSSRFERTKATNEIQRLKEQLKVFGIVPGDESGIKVYDTDLDRVAKQLYFDNVRVFECLTDETAWEIELEQLANAVQNKIYQLLYPIVKAICQILMPLGQHKNLKKTVEQALEILIQAGRKENPKIERVKTLFIEAIHESGVEITDTSQAISLGDNSSYLETIAVEAISEIDRLLKSEFIEIEKRAVSLETGNEEVTLSLELTSTSPAGQLDELGLNPKLSKRQVYESSKIYQAINNFVESFKLSATDSAPKQSSSRKTFLEVIDPGNPLLAAEADLHVPVSWNLKTKINSYFQSEHSKTDEERYPIHLYLPDRIDLSLWCSSIEDQGSLNSCTAQAGVALTEYFANKAFGKYTDVSALFLYKVARSLMHRQGDTGASVRETMKSMVLFGIPPEEHWPYDETKYDEDPTPFCYSFAQNYQALKYFRLDYAGIAPDTLLVQIKAMLVAEFPCMFGFTLYSTIHDEENVEKGHIPYPSNVDTMEGGHAVVAVGYDDHRIIENADGKKSQGAILIRNSWGTEWGAGGYGWLPYDYIIAGLTADWWSLLQSEWFESGNFGVASSKWSSEVGGRRKRGAT